MRRTVLTPALMMVALGSIAVSAPAQHGEMGSATPAARASIGFADVRPTHLDVLTGETVRWTNDSVRAHTVTADDGSFDSGGIVASDTFDRTFHDAGVVAYHCALHPSIRGVVGVHPLLLATPQQAAASNREFPLSGRAALPAGAPVTLEADRGAGFTPVATTTVASDGTFVAHVRPGGTATYRAVAEGRQSPPVTLLVLDRRITFQVRRAHRRVIVRTRVTPAAAGASVVLQLYLRERFGWWPVQRARLDRHSTARFSLPVGRRVAARVLLTLRDGATPLAVSRTVRLRRTVRKDVRRDRGHRAPPTHQAHE
jgi:plastocyanin